MVKITLSIWIEPADRRQHATDELLVRWSMVWKLVSWNRLWTYLCDNFTENVDRLEGAVIDTY